VQRTNAPHLCATVDAAHEIGLDSISFLAADLTSSAFNRPDGWTQERIDGVGLSFDELAVLESQIEALISSGECGGFVVESAGKLRKLARHFRCHLEGVEPVAPVCNAPWVSVVAEVDGTVRPCFFHPPVGKTDAATTLMEAINSPAAIAFRETLDVASNPVCRRCVCSLNWRNEPVAEIKINHPR
jgi:Fe-coproporphyrin III synthase